MELRLDESQVELQDAVQRFCTDRFPLDRIAEREGGGVDRAVWKELAALGVLGMLTPEERGGSGLGVLEAVVAFEQLGAHLASGPLLWSVLVSPLVEGVTTGDRVVGGLSLSGRPDDPVLVEHAGDVDALVLLGRDGVFLCEGDDLPPSRPVAPLDPLTPVGRLDAALPAGRRIGDAAVAARLRLVGTALSAALLVGVSATALDVSRGYALEREQFGVPIGSFQAVKHMIADMYVRTTLARSAAYGAATMLDGRDRGVADRRDTAGTATDAAGGAASAGGSGPGRAAGAAKLLAGEAAVENARAAVQVLGGMGFTWAMLPHYLLKRAWLLEHAFGTADEHALALGTAVGAEH